MNRSSRRFHPKLGILILATVLGSAPARAQAIPDDYQQGLFELEITDLPRVPIMALVGPDGALLFPLRAILHHGGVPFREDSAGYLIALIDAERRALAGRLDSRSPAITRGQDTLSARADEMIAADGDLYLSMRLLSWLLNAEVRADFAVLRVLVDPSVPLPAQLALEAERRRQLAMIRAAAAGVAPLPSTPLRAHSGAGVLHYSMSTGAPNTWTGTAIMLESGFAVLGGLGVLGYTGAPGGSVADPQLTFRYERFIPEQRFISFIRAGDVFAEGAFLRSMRGLTITNRPLRREGFFQDILVDPEVPPGYEVEVYQGGQLIGFSADGSRDPIRVPIVYGRTDLEVRMIAPSGEVVSTGLLYGVPSSQLPEAAFEYSTGAGFCHIAECERLFVSGDYGVRRWLTLGAGYEAEHDSIGFQHLPFARTIFAPRGGWLAETRLVAGRQLSGSAQYNGTAPVTGQLGLDIRSAQVPRATLLPQSATRWDARAEIGLRGHRAFGRVGGLATEGTDRWGAGYIAAIPRGLAIVQVEEFGGRAPELSLTGFRLVRRPLLHATATMSGRATMSEQGVRALEVGFSGGWGSSLFANAAIGWDRDAAFSLTLSFSRAMPIGHVAGVFSMARDNARATLRADGAVAFDAVDAVEPAGYTGIGFAGVDALVFRDANGNGLMDQGELPAVGVGIQAGGRSAVSDSSGHARLWGIVPWEKTTVRASSEWFDPHWAPAAPVTVIRPVAHIFNPLTIPLVATREFVAYLVPTEAIAGTAGIGFRLVNERTGRVREGLTLSDGSIYVSAVPVGDYLLEFDPAALEFLRARVEGAPILFTIGRDGADEFVFELPPIQLRRVPGE